MDIPLVCNSSIQTASCSVGVGEAILLIGIVSGLLSSFKEINTGATAAQINFDAWCLFVFPNPRGEVYKERICH